MDNLEEKKRKTALSIENDPNLPDLPRVTAVGHGYWAEKILEIAFSNDIKVREDPELADILGIIEEEQDIPPEAIVAVAEILSYIYAYDGKPEMSKENPFQIEQDKE